MPCCATRIGLVEGSIGRFDDPNLVSCAGLAPVMSLAQGCGLGRLVAERLTLTGDGAANAAAKVSCLVAGVVAGADSIDDMGLLRHGGMVGCSVGCGHRRLCRAALNGDVAYSNESVNGHVNADRAIIPERTR
jgi:hypothetical protein